MVKCMGFTVLCQFEEGEYSDLPKERQQILAEKVCVEAMTCQGKYKRAETNQEGSAV